MEKVQAQDAIQQLKVQLEEDAVKQNIKRKSELFNKCESKQSDEHKKSDIINLFAKSSKRDQKPLFSTEKGTVNLFKMNTPAKKLFGQKNVQEAKNIFNLADKPTIQNEDNPSQNEDVSNEKSIINDEGSPSKNSVFKTEPDQKVMKYQYEKQTEKIAQFNLIKFKSGTQPPKQQVYLTLQKTKNTSGILYLFIRNSVTKIVVFNAVMIKNISQINNLMNKKDTLKFEVVRKNKKCDGQTQQSKMSKQVVKLQFMGEKQSEQFRQKVQEAYKQ